MTTDRKIMCITYIE